MASGIHGASRLRFVGTEDIGGGTKANFWLEMQPNFQNGSVNADLFNRGAWLGLSSSSWGEIRLGRQGSNNVAAVCDIDQQGCYSGFYGGGILFSGNGGPGATGSSLLSANPTRGGTQAPSTLGGAGSVNAAGTAGPAGVDSTRYVRAIRYSLPEVYPGLAVNLTQAFGTTATATAGAGGNSTGFDANYTNGPLKVTAAYSKADADAGDTKKGDLTTVGAIYNLGWTSIGAGVQSETASGTGVAFTKGDAFAFTALFPLGAYTPYVKYGEHKYSGGTLGNVTNAKVINVGARYALSTRTYLYGDFVSNGAALGAAGATNTTFLPASQKSMISAGLSHSF
jgi:predicted porin